jgi:RNA polymerase primary sigma factor
MIYYEDEGLAKKLYFNEIKDCKGLSLEEEHSLISDIQKFNHKKSLDKLVKANLKFVVSIARNYDRQGVFLLDLVQEGNVGLIKAAYRFDEKRNLKFNSYAVWWVRQSILKAISEQAKITSTPANVSGDAYRINNIVLDFETANQRYPTQEEILEEYNLKYNGNNQSENGAKKPKMTVDKIKRCLDILKKDIHYDNFNLDDDDDKRKGFDIYNLSNEQFMASHETDYKTIHEETVEKLYSEKILKYANQKERKILELYYGLNDGMPYTLEWIGKEMKLTRERVRQIKNKAIQRIREAERIEILKSKLL